MYHPVFIFKNNVWQEIDKKDLKYYEFFVFRQRRFWDIEHQAWDTDLVFSCCGSYDTVQKAKTKITIMNPDKGDSKFRVMVRKNTEFEFYPADLGSKYTKRNLWSG